MDMKKILQAFDGASTKPVEGSNDMKKFLSVVTEGANPHKVTLPVQMAMQHYAEPKVEKPKTIKEVKKSAMSGLLHQYYTEAQAEVEEEAVAKKELISEQARQLAQRVLDKEDRVDELSKNTLRSYVKANKEDSVQRASSDSFKSGKAGDDYNKADEGHKDKMRERGLDRALDKIADPDYDKKKDSVKESYSSAEYDNEGEAAQHDLNTAEEAAEELRSILSSNENLPEWVQEKIIKAVDYLDTARDYMKSLDENRYRSRDAYQRDYDSSRTGFGRREREDDEYHVPDPVDNRVSYKVIATVITADGNEEKKGVSVKTTGGPKHAQSVATKHLEDAGLQVKVINSVQDLG